MTETGSDYTSLANAPRNGESNQSNHCPPELRRRVIEANEGRCYVCGIEEWRLGKSLRMHIFVPPKDGGKIEDANLAPMCTRCKRTSDGASPAKLRAMGWRRRKEAEEDEGGGLMALIADDKNAIPYRPRLNEITGNALASILLQQAIYWWFKSKRRPFYKWSAPCNHQKYNAGDSWQEELGLTRYELEGALKRLGKRIKRGESREEAMKTSFLVWWMDSEKTPWFMLNESLIENRLREIYAAAQDPDEEDPDVSDGPEGVDAEFPQRPREGGKVDAEIPHRGGGVNVEIPHSIYDAEIPHSIIDTSETTPETTYRDKRPMPSADADGLLIEEIKGRERTTKGTIRGLTNEEATVLIKVALEGESLENEIRRLMQLAASENTSNEMKMTRAWNEFVEPFVRARAHEKWSDDAWRYGFEAALRKPAGSLGYVTSTARKQHERTTKGRPGSPSVNGTNGHAPSREEMAAERQRQMEKTFGRA